MTTQQYIDHLHRQLSDANREKLRLEQENQRLREELNAKRWLPRLEPRAGINLN